MDTPARSHLLQRDTTLTKGHLQMPDLGGAPAHTPVNLTIDNESAANAGADGDVEDRRQSLAGAEERLGQARHVGIVAQSDRPAEQLADPRRQWEIVPSADLV